MDRRDRTMAMNERPHVLIVAGSDSSGGAGIARDIETVSAFGLRACVAITAVTVQTHDAVRAVETMPATLVGEQMRAGLEANPVAAIKIGMLASADTVQAIASVLRDHPDVPAILDPVLASSSGRALLEQAAMVALKQDLMPLCTLTTPNLPEIALLTRRGPAANQAEVIRQTEELLDGGCRAILAKGGHGQGADAVDILVRPDIPPRSYSLPRLNTEMRGTGCVLSSAIASLMARGEPLENAIGLAKEFLHERIGR